MKISILPFLFVDLGLMLCGRIEGGSPGEVDLSFDAGAIGPGVVQDVVTRPDGRLLIRGSFIRVQGIARPGLARLEADGTLDASFDPGTGVQGALSGWAVQEDGRVLLAGTLTAVNGVARTNYARLDADGSLDLSFEVPPRVSFVALRERRVVALADGRSLDLGWHGTTAWGVFRHTLEGDYDSGFDRPEVVGGLYPAFPRFGAQPDGIYHDRDRGTAVSLSMAAWWDADCRGDQRRVGPGRPECRGRW
jgi:hypothetical protein